MDSLNRDLFWKLAEPEHLKARAFCRKLMGSREDGDDLYQDALVRALGRFDSLRDPDAFRSWLYRIIISTFQNTLRRPWRRRRAPLTEEARERLAGDDPSPVHAARRTLARAFRAVSADDRALVTLFELEGWSVAELAALKGRSEAAVKMRMSRVRRKMRAALAEAHVEAAAPAKTKAETSEGNICVAAKPGLD